MGEAIRRPRATRYALSCPVKFRSAGATDWREGTLRNISESGLLFEPAGDIADAAELEMTIDLPPGISSILCTAVIARRDPASQAIGARITDYRLQPRRGVTVV